MKIITLYKMNQITEIVFQLLGLNIILKNICNTDNKAKTNKYLSLQL